MGPGTYVDPEDTCLFLAVTHRSHRVLERMLRCPDVQLSGCSRDNLLALAAWNRNLEAVRMLSNHHRHPTMTAYSMLYIVLSLLSSDDKHTAQEDIKIVRSVLSRCEMEAEELPDFINWYDKWKRPLVLRLFQLALGNDHLAKEVNFVDKLGKCVERKKKPREGSMNTRSNSTACNRRTE